MYIIVISKKELLNINKYKILVISKQTTNSNLQHSTLRKHFAKIVIMQFILSSYK